MRPKFFEAYFLSYDFNFFPFDFILDLFFLLLRCQQLFVELLVLSGVVQDFVSDCFDKVFISELKLQARLYFLVFLILKIMLHFVLVFDYCAELLIDLMNESQRTCILGLIDIVLIQIVLLEKSDPSLFPFVKQIVLK